MLVRPLQASRLGSAPRTNNVAPSHTQYISAAVASKRSVCSRSRTEDREASPVAAKVDDTPSPRLRLVDVLLGGAASRVQRGTCTCIHCRGRGATPCDSCKGGGIVEPHHGTARMNMVRHVMDKVSSFVGIGTKATGQQWLQTNRCRRCHGVGQLVCVNCKGSGLRYKAGPDDVCLLPEPVQ